MIAAKPAVASLLILMLLAAAGCSSPEDGDPAPAEPVENADPTDENGAAATDTETDTEEKTKQHNSKSGFDVCNTYGHFISPLTEH